MWNFFRFFGPVYITSKNHFLLKIFLICHLGRPSGLKFTDYVYWVENYMPDFFQIFKSGAPCSKSQKTDFYAIFSIFTMVLPTDFSKNRCGEVLNCFFVYIYCSTIWKEAFPTIFRAKKFFFAKIQHQRHLKPLIILVIFCPFSKICQNSRIPVFQIQQMNFFRYWLELQNTPPWIVFHEP